MNDNDENYDSDLERRNKEFYAQQEEFDKIWCKLPMTFIPCNFCFLYFNIRASERGWTCKKLYCLTSPYSQYTRLRSIWGNDKSRVEHTFIYDELPEDRCGWQYIYKEENTHICYKCYRKLQYKTYIFEQKKDERMKRSTSLMDVGFKFCTIGFKRKE